MFQGLLMLLYQRRRALVRAHVEKNLRKCLKCFKHNRRPPVFFQSALGKTFSPVYLVGPNQIMSWLHQYHDHCQEILDHIKYVDAVRCRRLIAAVAQGLAELLKIAPPVFLEAP